MIYCSYEENESNACYAGLLTFSFGGYVLALAGVIVMFIIYTTVIFYAL